MVIPIMPSMYANIGREVGWSVLLRLPRRNHCCDPRFSPPLSQPLPRGASAAASVLALAWGVALVLAAVLACLLVVL